MELVGLPNAKKSHTRSQSHFTPPPSAASAGGWAHPHPSLCFHQKFVRVQQILKRPSESGRLRPSADMKLS